MVGGDVLFYLKFRHPQQLAKKSSTRKRAIAKALQRRPPDVVPVLIPFTYDAHAKFEVAWHPLPFYRVFTADTLRYTVTLTFDPVNLTFDL